MSTTTLTQLKAKSATLIKPADDKLASATSSVTKIDKKISRTEEKHTEIDAGIHSLGATQQDLKAAILFPDIYVAAKQQPELALTVQVLKYRLAEEITEKERFKAKFAEASTASTREKREKKSLIKAMAEMQLAMDAMQAQQDAMQLAMAAMQAQQAEMQRVFAKERNDAEAHFELRVTTIERCHEDQQTAKDETIEFLEDKIKYYKSVKGATFTQAALDKLEVMSAAGLWSN
jgi:chromosome segregation ATPase